MVKFVNPFKSKKKEKEKKEAVAGTKIRVIVKRRIGQNIPAHMATFVADMNKDRDMNIYLENQDYDFKESISIVKQEIIDNLRYKLDLMNMNYKQKLEQVNKKIKEQENRLKRIKHGYIYPTEEEKKESSDAQNPQKVNILDERALLTNYKVLLDEIKNGDDMGSYEEFNENGERQIMFMYNDGILYPIYHPANKNTNYPDMASKRKIHSDNRYDIDKEFMEETANPWQNFWFKALWVLAFVALISGVIWNIENQRRAVEIQEMLNDGTIGKIVDQSAGSIAYCSAVYKQMVEDNADLIEYAQNEILNKSGKEPPSKEEIKKNIDLTEQITGDKNDEKD